MGWFQRVLAFLFGTSSASPTPSAVTQSSFHLAWIVPPGPAIVAVEATLVVDADPSVDKLYFWALQASFSDAFTTFGGAHTGLQWNPRFPAHRAVNWGGYHDQRFGGAVLDGTESALPSTPNDRNTRDYSWLPGRGYRFRISRGSAPDRWRSSVTDVTASETVVIRELECRGDRLTAPIMWSEVFASCDDPSVSIHWSDLTVEREDGTIEAISEVETRYQAATAGGCLNTNSDAEGGRFVQTTNTNRTNPPGTRLGIS
jgi:hypothetical protein